MVSVVGAIDRVLAQVGIRHVLWTTSYEFVRLFETDFHIYGSKHATSLFIEAMLADLSPGRRP